jgi:putative FmdB family regulatory protein
MPIYEYQCSDCNRRVSLLWRSMAAAAEGTPVCPRCGGQQLRRLISRVAVVRSEESRLDTLADTNMLGDLDENDPRSMARWMKRMSREMGEDLGDEFHEVVERLEAGESPEAIENAMPDLAGGPGGGSDFGVMD